MKRTVFRYIVIYYGKPVVAAPKDIAEEALVSSLFRCGRSFYTRKRTHRAYRQSRTSTGSERRALVIPSRLPVLTHFPRNFSGNIYKHITTILELFISYSFYLLLLLGLYIFPPNYFISHIVSLTFYIPIGKWIFFRSILWYLFIDIRLKKKIKCALNICKYYSSRYLYYFFTLARVQMSARILQKKFL